MHSVLSSTLHPTPGLPHPLRHASTAMLAACLLLAPPVALQAQPGAAQPRRGEAVTLNFSNADIESVARTIAIITGRSVVLDARVKGVVNMQSERPVTPAQAVNQFAAALRLQGFALVDSDGMYKVLPEADAKLQARLLPPGRRAAGNQVVSQVFKLRYENANNLLPALRPLISPNNTINASNAHTLVVTDYADNLQRVARLIAGMDQPPGHDMEVIPLRYGIASEMAPLVQKLLAGGSAAAMPGQPAPAGAGAPGLTIVPEARSNALVVRAPTPAQAKLARNLILKLDQPALSSGNGDAGNIWVVHLKNADAVKVAATLRAALAANQANAGGAPGVSVNVGNSSQAGGTPQVQVTATSALQGSGAPSTGGPIQADPATNSLVITASEPEYRQLRAVIDRLDTRRAQVYVESLIAEVNDNKLANIGVQWQGTFNGSGSQIGLIGTNYGATGNILGLSGALAGAALGYKNSGTVSMPGTLPARGLNVGSMINFRGIPILGMVANFLQSTGSANILSTPNLITLDNEEARIMIGQNVPFVTGSYTANNSANGSVNPFQTYERKDVGLTLRVKPQISENGNVKMQIYQEVSNVDPATRNDPSGPTTNKRSIESSVVVGDGQVLVLGGLLSDQYANSQDKVPLLGDVPLLGNLFKNENRSRQKSNLMVFLRPIIVRDDAESSALTLDRYDMMRASQIQAQPEPGVVQPYQAPVLPPVKHPENVWTPVSAPGVTAPAPLIYQNMAPARVFRPDGSQSPAQQPYPVWDGAAPAAPVSQAAPQPGPAASGMAATLASVQQQPTGLVSGYGLVWNAPPEPVAAPVQPQGQQAPTAAPQPADGVRLADAS